MPQETVAVVRVFQRRGVAVGIDCEEIVVSVADGIHGSGAGWVDGRAIRRGDCARVGAHQGGLPLELTKPARSVIGHEYVFAVGAHVDSARCIECRIGEVAVRLAAGAISGQCRDLYRVLLVVKPPGELGASKPVGALRRERKYDPRAHLGCTRALWASGRGEARRCEP